MAGAVAFGLCQASEIASVREMACRCSHTLISVVQVVPYTACVAEGSLPVQLLCVHGDELTLRSGFVEAVRIRVSICTGGVRIIRTVRVGVTFVIFFTV